MIGFCISDRGTRQAVVGCDSNVSMQQGFTMLELIVVMIIFTMMTTLVMFNFKDFSRSVELDVLAQEIALEIKNAQTIGSSSIGDSLGGTSGTVVSIVFRNDGSNFDSEILTTREKNSSVSYDSSDTVLRSSAVRGGYIVSISECSNSCNALNETVLVSFKRPDPEPIITSQGCSSQMIQYFNNSSCVGSIQIRVTDDKQTAFRDIIIEPSGYIGVHPVEP